MSEYSLDCPPQRPLTYKKLKEIYDSQEEFSEEQRKKLKHYLKVKKKFSPKKQKTRKAEYIAQKIGVEIQ